MFASITFKFEMKIKIFFTVSFLERKQTIFIIHRIIQLNKEKRLYPIIDPTLHRTVFYISQRAQLKKILEK